MLTIKHVKGSMNRGHSSDSDFFLSGLACDRAVTCCSMQMIKAELVLWVAGFVLLSLIVNAPMLPWLLNILRLNIGKLLALAATPLPCCLWYTGLPVLLQPQLVLVIIYIPAVVSSCVVVRAPWYVSDAVSWAYRTVSRGRFVRLPLLSVIPGFATAIAAVVCSSRRQAAHAAQSCGCFDCS